MASPIEENVLDLLLFMLSFVLHRLWKPSLSVSRDNFSLSEKKKLTNSSRHTQGCYYFSFIKTVAVNTLAFFRSYESFENDAVIKSRENLPLNSSTSFGVANECKLHFKSSLPKAWFPYRCICRICRVCRTKNIHRTDRIHSISYSKLYLSFLLY